MTMHPISGKTRLNVILAHPVAHVRTPQAINELATQRGVDAVMVPIEVAPPDLGTVVQALRSIQNLDGIVVTVPHKTSIAQFCDVLTERALQAGAVNAIRREANGRLVGDMFDGLGFTVGLERAGIEIRGRRAFLAGAGGAANAIAFALAERGVQALSIYNRTHAKAEELATRVAAAFPHLRVGAAASADPTGHDLVVNATSLGLKPTDALPIDVAKLEPDMIVAEVIMQPETTPLLEAARQCGCRIQPGRAMLTSQLELIADHLGLTGAA
jgi:shikimate dehydrogenase